jgi:acyl-CoA carboxylase epsilon subunit
VSEPDLMLRVVSGQPTPEELAALVVVLSAQPPAPAPAAPTRPSGWADRAAAIRAPLAPGPGAWRASGRQS